MIRIFWYFIFFEFGRYVVLEFWVLFVYWLGRKKRAAAWEAAKQALYNEMPLISLIAPGKNEGKNIFKLVKSLNEQTYQNVEVIIVDDGSDDETPIIGRNLEKNGLIDLFIRNDMRGGKASAANLAWRYSTGKFLLHLDADCSFDRTAVENIIIPFYLDPEIGGVGGNVKVRNGDVSLCARLQSIEYTKFKVLWKQRLRWSRSLVRFRLRKHLDVFLPHKNWRWGTFLGFVENIFYNFVLDLKWYIYIIDMIVNFSSWIWFLIPMNLALYMIAGFMQQLSLSLWSDFS